MIQCNSGILGPGEYCDKSYVAGLPKVDFFCTPGFYFDSIADAADESKWDEAIAAGNIRVVRNIKDNTPEDVETSFIETSRGEKIKDYEGKRGDMHMVLQSLEAHQYMFRTWNDKDWSLIKCDTKGVLQAWLDKETGRVYPIDLGMLNVDYMKTKAVGVANYTIIQFQEEDLSDLDVNGFYWKPDWNVLKKKGLQVVQASASPIATNAFVLTIQYEKPTTANGDGTLIVQPIIGATVDNVVLEDENGDILVPTTDYTVTDNADGTYAVDASLSGITSGRLKIKATAPSFLYESDWIELA